MALALLLCGWGTGSQNGQDAGPWPDGGLAGLRAWQRGARGLPGATTTCAPLLTKSRDPDSGVNFE